MTNNTTLFDRLVTETQKLASEPLNPLSKGRLKRWNNLAAHWGSDPAFPDVFFETFYHILCNRYYRNRRNMGTFMSLLEEAMLTDTDAVRAWSDGSAGFLAGFRRMYLFVHSSSRKKRWKSAAMREYMVDKLRCLLFFRNAPIPQMNLKILRDRRACRRIANQLDVQSTCSRFEELIKLLVPSSCSWHSAQWHNEAYIFAQIKSFHGIDYSQHLDDFDDLVTLYKRKAEGLPYYKDLFAIHTLPASIASLIWPANIEKEICKQFHFACDIKPWLLKNGTIPSTDPVNPLNMVNSWAFQQLVLWYKGNNPTISGITRGKLLLIGIGEHPWIVNYRQRKVV